MPGSSADWLLRAKSDLSLASVPLPQNVLYNDLCFHAQQAVEKSIKAVLIHYQIEFPRVHHINYLLTLLPSEVSKPPEVEKVSTLTSYAVMLRYPGEYEEVTVQAYQEAIRLARLVLEWAEKVVK